MPTGVLDINVGADIYVGPPEGWIRRYPDYLYASGRRDWLVSITLGLVGIS